MSNDVVGSASLLAYYSSQTRRADTNRHVTVNVAVKDANQIDFKMGNTSSTNGRPNPDTSRLLLILWVLHRYWSVVMESRNSVARSRTTESRDQEDSAVKGTHDDTQSQFSACACNFCQDDGLADCSRYCASFA